MIFLKKLAYLKETQKNILQIHLFPSTECKHIYGILSTVLKKKYK